jgi:hypothetical protein
MREKEDGITRCRAELSVKCEGGVKTEMADDEGGGELVVDKAYIPRCGER